MLDFSLTDEQELLLESVREWLRQNVAESDLQQWYWRDHGVPADVTKAWIDAGFGYLGIPEEHGGMPCDFVTLGLVIEEVARHCACLMPFAANTLGIYDMIEFGSPAQVRQMVDIFAATGQAAFSVVMSEPGAGSDSMAITTTATEDGDEVHLNGTKTWVTLAEVSPYMLVIAKDGDPAGPSTSLWLLPKDTPGITISPISKIGTYMMPFCDVYFDDVVIGRDAACGQRGKGFANFMKNLEMERTLILAQNVGIAQAAMDDAAAYVSQRTTFGQPIASYQLIQEKLTDMEIKIRNMRNLLYQGLWKLDNGQSVRLDSALLKRYGALAATEVCNDAVQIFGGLGYTHETRVSRAFLDTRGSQIGGGTNEIMVHIAGRLIAKQYAAK